MRWLNMVAQKIQRVMVGYKSSGEGGEHMEVEISLSIQVQISIFRRKESKSNAQNRVEYSSRRINKLALYGWPFGYHDNTEILLHC